MNSSPHAQAYAYRRNPAQSVHHSTFQPQQGGHSHSHSYSHGSTLTQARPPQGHYTTSVVPFQPAQSTTAAAEVKEKDKKPASGGGFNLASLAKYANIDELKGLVDRFGGLEGILSTVTTVQKVVSTVGQIAPMVKVVTGVLGKNKDSGQAESAAIPARRRVRSNRPQQRTTNTARSTRTTRAPASARTTRRNSSANQSAGPRRSTPYRPTAGRR